MPRNEIEIKGEKTVTVSEVISIVVDVPQDVLDGDLYEWVEKQMQNPESEVSKAASDEVNVTVEDETEGYGITEVNDMGPHD